MFDHPLAVLCRQFGLAVFEQQAREQQVSFRARGIGCHGAATLRNGLDIAPFFGVVIAVVVMEV